ncbi:dihydrofolate reductase family protein [Saccharomonospora iraqiensis]|uniref:dihydrofolate reductase family protein n=1 Tax=Saccharomonospora iraqiensis TaxID=52698 RepID=UPI000478D9BD|nr:dihydrofolate reductase family protein [Saccharomonospora iraqiensis]
MRKLTYLVASTIDGRITDPGGGNPDFFLAEGDHAVSLVEEYPEIVPSHVRPLLGLTDAGNTRFDTVLQGRGSYEIGLREGVTNAYRHLRSLVFSTTMTKSPDPTVELVRGDPVPAVRELKRENGAGIWLCGGGKLAAALRSEIDELIVKLHPVVVGDGIPLFDGGFAPERFDLVDTRVFRSGVLHLTYRRGG